MPADVQAQGLTSLVQQAGKFSGRGSDDRPVAECEQAFQLLKLEIADLPAELRTEPLKALSFRVTLAAEPNQAFHDLANAIGELPIAQQNRIWPTLAVGAAIICRTDNSLSIESIACTTEEFDRLPPDGQVDLINQVMGYVSQVAWGNQYKPTEDRDAHPLFTSVNNMMNKLPVNQQADITLSRLRFILFMPDDLQDAIIQTTNEMIPNAPIQQQPTLRWYVEEIKRNLELIRRA
ncbi:hypothetical protein DID99_35600 [Burkholderia sp. Bp8986]|nr:hypothetical protein DID99_35600 [Burkholderia sp. Bp8986]